MSKWHSAAASMEACIYTDFLAGLGWLLSMLSKA